MPKFQVETSLPVSADQLASDLLTMSGVNYELGPLLNMSAPSEWNSKAIFDWPTNSELFTSTVLMFGFLPIDRHRFNFLSVHRMGFKESSSALLNKEWCHERVISENGSGATVTDVVYYESKLGFIGYLFKPLYKSVFVHRHKRLRSRYAKKH